WLAIYDDGNNEKINNDEKFNKINKVMEEIAQSLKIDFKAKKFCKTINSSLIKANIGGENDNNDKLTYRMLILLESQPIYNNSLHKNLLEKLFNLYVQKTKPENKIPLGFINEILRYYRTMCLDYRYKTEEIENTWALRTIKLRISRKILCFSPIALIFNGIPKNEKMYDYIFQNINKPPLEKLVDILIEKSTMGIDITNSADIFYLYDQFLDCINSSDRREKLKQLNYQNRKNEKIYNELREIADSFHSCLINFLRNNIEDGENLIFKYLIF
ncbi:MAG: hypothetical protein ACTSRL_15425, partial [Candidatus Helarchaeota archaeon]